MNTESICAVIIVAVCSRYTDDAAGSAMRRLNASISELHEAKQNREGVNGARSAFQWAKARAAAAVALDALVMLFVAAAVAVLTKDASGVIVAALAGVGIGAAVRVTERFDLLFDVLGAEECDGEEGQ